MKFDFCWIRSLALLAMALPVGSLHATTVLPTSGLTCTYYTFGFNMGCAASAADASLPPGQNGVSGVEFWLKNSLTSFNSDTNGLYTTTVKFTTTGLVTGTTLAAGTVIPFEWDFGLALDLSTYGGIASLTGPGTGWTVQFDLKQGGTSIFSSTPTFSGANAAWISGTGSAVTSTPIVAGLSYTLTATLTDVWSRTAGAPGLTITIPQNSLDFNYVPEPGTAGLMAMGAILGLALPPEDLGTTPELATLNDAQIHRLLIC